VHERHLVDVRQARFLDADGVAEIGGTDAIERCIETPGKLRVPSRPDMFVERGCGEHGDGMFHAVQDTAY